MCFYGYPSYHYVLVMCFYGYPSYHYVLVMCFYGYPSYHYVLVMCFYGYPSYHYVLVMCFYGYPSYHYVLVMCFYGYRTMLKYNNLVVFVLNKVSLNQNKSHSRSLDLHIVYVNEGLPEDNDPSDWLL